jgi:hypothetical protein
MKHTLFTHALLIEVDEAHIIYPCITFLSSRDTPELRHHLNDEAASECQGGFQTGLLVMQNTNVSSLVNVSLNAV